MRVCARLGCGKKLVDRRGLPVYKDRFCGKECRALDRVAQLQLKRANLKKARRQCSGCNRSTRSFWIEIEGKPIAVRSLPAAFKFGLKVGREKLKFKYGHSRKKR